MAEYPIEEGCGSDPSRGLYILQQACANELIDGFSTGLPFDIVGS
jgi:hypothetical protein